MSTTIDSKVVEMRFDNQQFERGINQSISSIDRLKASLGFNNVGSGLNKIASGVGTITTQFNSLGVIAKRVLENIADTAFSTGTRIVKSLSIDQISEGWYKYEDIIRSTQTIMAATKTNWIEGTEAFKNYAAEVDKWNKEQVKAKKNGGTKFDADTEARLRNQRQALIDLTKNQTEQMKYVNAQLDKLNWYTDETSYNLVDMTSNIGKFTAAGINLQDATNAMMGIASWAAISGANVQQASRAMYNLSQAMGMGELKLQDWMSIENANMATLEFKNTAIKTAYAMGTLKKDAEGCFYTFDKSGNKVIVTAENFRSTLATKWFDKKVITETLKVYGEFANDLYKYTQDTGLTATQLLSYTDKVKKGLLDINDTVKMADLGKELGLDEDQLKSLTEGLKEMSSATKDLGFNAFRAAQEAKTFTEAIQYVKDAVSTGWMNTFKTIFGDYMNAKDLWTEVSEEFYDIFVLDVEKQNEVLKKWADMGGREQLLWGIKKLWRSIKAIFSTIRNTFEEIFPPKTGEFLYNISMKFHTAMNQMEKDTKPLTQRVRYILLPAFRGFKNILDSIIIVSKSVKKAFSNIFNVSDINILEDATNLFEKLTKTFKITEERSAKLERIFTGLFSIFDIIKMAVQELLKAFLGLDEKESNIADGALDIAASFGDWVKSIRDWLKENGTFKKAAKWIYDFVKKLPEKIDKIWTSLTGMDFKSWCDKLVKEDLPKIAEWIGKHIPGIREDLEKTGKAVEKVSGGIGDIISYGKDLGLISGATEELNSSLQGLAQYLRQVTEETKKTLKPPQSAKEWEAFFKSIQSWIKVIFYLLVALKFWEKIQNYTKPLKDVKKGVVDLLESWKFNMNLDAVGKIVKSLKTLTLCIIALSIIPKDKMLAAAGVLGGFFIAMSALMLMMSKIKADPKQLSAIGALVTSIGLTMTSILGSVVLISYLAERNLPAVLAAMGAVVVTLAALAIVVNKLSKIQFDNQQLLGLSISLMLMAAAISAIGAAIMLATANNSDWSSIAAAGGALATVLLSMAVALKIMPKNNDIANAAGSLMVVGAALLLVAGALTLVASIGDPAKLVGGAAALALMMGTIAASIYLLSKSGDGADLVATAGALAIASVGLIALAYAIKIISEVVASGNALGSFLLLAGALGALAVAAILCSNPAVTAALYAIGAACALIGVGALAAGAGLVLFASAVERLAAVGPDGVLLLVTAIREFSKILPEIAVKVAQAIVALLDYFVKSKDQVVEILAGLITMVFDVLIKTTPKLFEFLGTVITGVCQLVITKAPDIANAIIVLVMEVLKLTRIITPEITKTLFAIIVDTLRQIRDNIEEIVKLSVEIGILTITGFIKGITEQIPNLVSTAWEFILAFINGISDGVDKYAVELKKAIDKLATAIINGFCTILGIKSPSKVFDGFGVNIVQGLINGITGMASKAWDAITKVATDIIEGAKSTITSGLAKAREAIEKFKQSFINVGSNLINAIKTGMEKAKDKLVSGAKAVGDTIIDAVKKVFKIKSPSRVFMEIGKFLDEGLAVGMDEYAYKAVDSSEELAYETTDSIRKAIAAISDMMTSSIGYEPTIKPVLDLSDVSDGVNKMDGMLSASRSISLASSSGGSISSAISAQQQTNAMLDSLKSTLSGFMDDNQGTVTNNNTFNITGDNPKEIAKEVSRILQNDVERRDAAWAL
jgi:hypothetical protein